jgi:hypothetical protein
MAATRLSFPSLPTCRSRTLINPPSPKASRLKPIEKKVHLVIESMHLLAQTRRTQGKL